jgi:hypothetical protein
MSALMHLVIIVLLLAVFPGALTDKLKEFYDRLSHDDVVHCGDKTKLLPDCTECIPGTRQGKKSKSCNEYIESSEAIRKEIGKLTLDRYGPNLPADRLFGLYPYLETSEFMIRQELFGEMMSKDRPKDIIDIGAYYNPINLFFTANDYCPRSVVVIEPILDPLSAYVPCKGVDGARTLVTFLPITFRYFISIKDKLPRPDAVVCIGCDSHYGPNRQMLETTFPKPYTLYFEYPSEYVHNQPFKKMMGYGKGENMTMLKKYIAKTNATMYTKRVMKVIKYDAV